MKNRIGKFLRSVLPSFVKPAAKSPIEGARPGMFGARFLYDLNGEIHRLRPGAGTADTIQEAVEFLAEEGLIERVGRSPNASDLRAIMDRLKKIPAGATSSAISAAASTKFSAVTAPSKVQPLQTNPNMNPSASSVTPSKVAATAAPSQILPKNGANVSPIAPTGRGDLNSKKASNEEIQIPFDRQPVERVDVSASEAAALLDAVTVLPSGQPHLRALREAVASCRISDGVLRALSDDELRGVWSWAPDPDLSQRAMKLRAERRTK